VGLRRLPRQKVVIKTFEVSYLAVADNIELTEDDDGVCTIHHMAKGANLWSV
jgi:hypothetical protein